MVVRPRPACPLHPDSRVWLDGTYGRGRRKRQRFKCTPKNGERRHVFTEPLPRTIAPEHQCWECERPVALHEGPPAPRKFEFTVREIAETLIMVGAGSTYRGAGRDIRNLTDRTNGRWRHFDGSNIADWVELFAPAIFEVHRPREWLPIVAIDSVPFATSGGRLNTLGHPLQGGRPAFHVFAAMGYAPFHAGEVKLLGLQAFPGFEFRQGRPYWIEFLTSLDGQLGGAPRQFVCDGDADLEAAIQQVWPVETPEVFVCHHHMRHHILRDLRQLGVAADDELYLAAKAAFDTSEAWLRFERLAHERRNIGSVMTWLRRNGNRAAWQIAHQTGHITDTTAVEEYLADLRAMFALRRGTFRNRERLNRLLMLMMLRQRHVPRVSDYAHIIREQLLDNGGRAGRRRQIDDPHGTSSLYRPHTTRHEAAVEAEAEAARLLARLPPEFDEDIPF